MSLLKIFATENIESDERRETRDERNACKKVGSEGGKNPPRRHCVATYPHCGRSPPRNAPAFKAFLQHQNYNNYYKRRYSSRQ